jgi:excisionase family DNA binding protein
MSDPELLTTLEVAALLRVHPVTVLREIRKGRLPAKKVGRSWRVARASLKGFFPEEGER